MGTLQQISSLVVGEMWGLRFLNALLSGKIWGLRLCLTERRLGTIFVRSIDGRMAEENKKVCFKIHCFLSIKQSKICTYVKNLYVFVGIGNFKIPLCIYYCL